jgi:hypothetical protein
MLTTWIINIKLVDTIRVTWKSCLIVGKGRKLTPWCDNIIIFILPYVCPVIVVVNPDLGSFLLYIVYFEIFNPWFISVHNSSPSSRSSATFADVTNVSAGYSTSTTLVDIEYIWIDWQSSEPVDIDYWYSRSSYPTRDRLPLLFCRYSRQLLYSTSRRSWLTSTTAVACC